MAESLQEELINFMFLRDETGKMDIMRCLGLWFGKSNDTDIEIDTRFGSHVATALEGGYESWKLTPRGCLALMILIDQFPRNIYRHTVQSFAGDDMSRAIVDVGHDWLQVLKPEECLFVPCLIMTHQENVASQQKGVEFYNKLEPHLPTELHIFRTIFEEHLRIIELCGTFPHRDHYYGRVTSDAGKKLMENPKVRFDLPLVAENGTIKFGHDPKKLWFSTQRAFDVLERLEALAMDAERRRSSVQPASWLSQKEIAECHETFRAFDKDGNGSFDREELGTVLASTGKVYTEAQLQKAMDRISGEVGGNSISFQQFSALLRSKRRESNFDEKVIRRFNMFDADGSGEIDMEELRSCIQSIDDLVTSAEIEEMLKTCDTDHSGTLSFEEFRAFMPNIMARKVERVEFTTPAYDDLLSQVAVHPVAT